MQLLDNLNPEQKKAVLHKGGPLMIIAGAGSGKTKVLTTRIAYLMAIHKVDPFHILALTFTNKAAAEMKSRIDTLLGNAESRSLYIGTYHSVFARILRTESHWIGYPGNFTIYDTDDSRNVIKAIVQEMQLDDKLYKPSIVHNRISAAKNALIGPEEYNADASLLEEDQRQRRSEIGNIFLAYCLKCFKNGAMDFDDLLLKMYELLRNFPAVLYKYQNKFKYVLVDEYQDTNATQYAITKMLAATHENICVVGDDAQSIYSFRGATIENILQFKSDYDDVAVVKLEQNYRSTSNILNIANEIISNNTNQIQKSLWTNAEPGEKVKIARLATDNDEGRFVADAILEAKLRLHFKNSDFAILYRTNAQSRAFEECLRRMNIPYRIYGGISFYQRKEVKDLLSYLKFIANPKDEEALKRIINYPARGIGKTSIEKLLIWANETGNSIWEAITNAALVGLKGASLESLQQFHRMIRYLQSISTTNNAYEVAVQTGKHTGLVKELFADKTIEGIARYENIQELLNSMKDWVEDAQNRNQIDEDGVVQENDTILEELPEWIIESNTKESPKPDSIGAYLQQISLLTDIDTDKNIDADVLSLMTIHAAKGLEFPCVFVGGMEETLFPNALAINTREELEEERRLFYVAITRAKSKLWLSHAETRYKFGQLVSNDASRFLTEIPSQFAEKIRVGGGLRNPSPAPSGSAYQRLHSGFRNSGTSSPPKYSDTQNSKPQFINPIHQQTEYKHTPTEAFTADDTSRLAINDSVEHQKFGFGKVLQIEGASHNPIATVQFEHSGSKKIMLNYAKLRIIKNGENPHN